MVISSEYFIFISAFIVAIYLLMIWIGYKKGFLYELLSLFYTALSLFAAWFAAPVFSSLFPLFDLNKFDEKYELLNKVFDLNTMLNTVAYFLIIFLILKLLYMFISLLVKSLNKIPVIGSFNQLLGGAFGIVHATLIVLALSMLLYTPLVENGRQVREQTLLKYISSYSDEAFTFIVEKVSDGNIREKFDDIDMDSYRQQLKEWLISKRKNDER